MRIYIARHGHKASSESDYDGGFNTPLSEKGRAQAEHLAEYLAGEELDAIYSSCQLRALETARPVHEHTGVDWHVWPVFYEGIGTTWQERHAEDPAYAESVTSWRTDEPIEIPTRDALAEKHGNYYLLSEIPERFPGTQLTQPFDWPEAWWEVKQGYSRETGYARADLGCQGLLSRHDDGDRLAIICHIVIASMLVKTFMDLRRNRLGLGLDTAGVHRIDRRDGDYWRFAYLNRTCHLRSSPGG